MATAMAVSCPTLTGAGAPASIQASVASSSKKSSQMSVRRLKGFGGLKPETEVTALGLSQCTEKAFSTMRAQCYASYGGARGGAAASTCDVASEILTIVPIMCGLTLLGVAIGFVLLRVEAAVEESE